MLRLESPSFQSNSHTKMPSKNHAVFPGLQDSTAGNYSSPGENCHTSDQNGNEHVHLPHIENDTPTRSKTERKPSRFFKFSSERQSFTENLLSFFTGNRDKGHDKCHTIPEELNKNDTVLQRSQNSQMRRQESTTNERITRSTSNQTSNKQPLRRTSKPRINATTKNDSFRPVTGGSKNNSKNIDVESDVGGYETMYKMKQPIGKNNVPRKRSLEISEYIRRENYKYNERTAKEFLFQKWLRSTEKDLPERFIVDHEDFTSLK